MSSLKKCPNCDTWNENLERCKNCNELLDYWQIRAKEAAQKDKEFRERPIPKSDQIFMNMKTSRFWLIRGIYYALYSVWALLIAIVSFFMMLIAYGPG